MIPHISNDSWYSSGYFMDAELFNQAVQVGIFETKRPGVSLRDALKGAFPGLVETDLDQLVARVRELDSFVWDICEQEAEGKANRLDLDIQIKKRFPGLNKATISRLISRGMSSVRR